MAKAGTFEQLCVHIPQKRMRFVYGIIESCLHLVRKRVEAYYS